MSERELPEGWRLAKLGDICSIVIGRTPRRAEERYWGGSHTWATIGDMTASDGIVHETRESLSDAGAALCGDRLLPAGTLMFSFKLSIGHIAFAGCDLYTNEAIAGITPYDDREVDVLYLRRALSIVDYDELIGHAAKGRTLNRKTLALLEIPLPPLDEQRRIVVRLEEQMATAERARAAAQAQLAAIEAMPQALLREIFPRSPADGLPVGWRWATLGDVVINTPNVDPRSDPAVEFSYIDIAAIDRNAKAIRDTKTLLGAAAPSRARRAVAVGDVIVSTTRPNLNAVALVPPELDGAVCSTGFCVLRCGPTVTAAYLYYLVQSQGFVEQMTEKMTGASYPAVTDKVVRAFSFPLPPLEQQLRLVERLERQAATVEGLRRTAQAQLDALDALPAAALRLAFAP